MVHFYGHLLFSTLSTSPLIFSNHKTLPSLQKEKKKTPFTGCDLDQLLRPSPSFPASSSQPPAPPCRWPPGRLGFGSPGLWHFRPSLFFFFLSLDLKKQDGDVSLVILKRSSFFASISQF